MKKYIVWGVSGITLVGASQFIGASQFSFDSSLPKNLVEQAELFKDKRSSANKQDKDVVFNVGFLTLCGSPFLWQDEFIVTKVYIRLQPGSGADLAIAPEDIIQTADSSKVGISFASEEREKLIPILTKAHNSFCTVQGKFIMLGQDSIPPYLGTILEAKVTGIVTK